MTKSAEPSQPESMRIYFRYVGYTATLPDGRCVTTERSYPQGLSVAEYRRLVIDAMDAFPFCAGGNLEFRTQTMLVAK